MAAAVTMAVIVRGFETHHVPALEMVRADPDGRVRAPLPDAAKEPHG